MLRNSLTWLKQRAAGICAVGLLMGTGLWIISEQQSALTPAKLQQAKLPVTVLEVTPAEAQFDISATGITMARWSTEIIASVSGRVEEVADGTLPGSLVKQGDVLASIQDVDYLAEIKTAQARLSEAELNLAEILSRQHVVTTIDNASTAFGRFEPHVRAAKANFNAADTALASANRQLADTTIKAPFNAVVIADLIHAGKWVNSGDALFLMAASDFLDIKVELSEQNWQRLNIVQSQVGLSSSTDITVVAPDGQRWPASIRYLSPVLDAVTRQRSMVLQVADPYQRTEPLLAEQQVRVEFAGETSKSVVKAPSSVLTEDGRVWSVVNETLRSEAIQLLDEQPMWVFFRYQNQPEQKRLLVRFPLSSFLEGQLVTTTTI